MNELTLIKSAEFGEIQCDFYGDGKDFWMTRDQIGAALEYSNPRDAIAKIHKRKKARLDKFSGVVRLSTPGGEQEVTVYNRKGIMEICRHSDQPKADAFMDFCWEVMDSLMSGKTKLVGMTEYQQMMAQTRAENARIRKAQSLIKIADEYDGTYRQIMHAYATKELTGEFLLPLPKLEAKTYSAEEIGETLGISKQMVGILTNRHGLKTDLYGAWFNDKAKGHSKEVQSFRYYENIIPVLRGIISQSA